MTKQQRFTQALNRKLPDLLPTLDAISRRTDMTTTAETKVVNLHAALTLLLEAHKDLIKDTNSEPAFGEDQNVTDAERALFENRPLADWERR